MPEHRLEADWPFPQRLPLAGGWSGSCTAPGQDGVRPCEDELRTACNIGYAKHCSRLPADRHADAVRFILGEESDGVLHVRFACELRYLPASHGELLYEKASANWLRKHDDARIQRMAECYVQIQLERRARS